ncbi:MAG: hypothetical protein J0H71_15175 [Rhizobiales bacterium]|nr:hypothetical protein [Hyphomicrobiales bacterium]
MAVNVESGERNLWPSLSQRFGKFRVKDAAHCSNPIPFGFRRVDNRRNQPATSKTGGWSYSRRNDGIAVFSLGRLMANPDNDRSGQP